MRKQYKNKKRCCGLCKPHKRGLNNRWSDKETSLAKEAIEEIAYGIEYLYDLYLDEAEEYDGL